MNFGIGEIKFSNKKAFVLIILAYFFSLAVRFYYYTWASKIPEFLWNGTLMINNVDGYYFAAGAKELLNHSHIVGDLNPYHSLVSMVTAGIVKLFPFLTLDQVILWLPAIFGSLVVVPLFLIGRTLKNDILGFVAALIGGIAWSYYNRTMVGYYDTDMLVITFLVFIFWGILEFFVNDNKKMILVVPLMIILYEGWYFQCRTVLLAFLAFAFVYSFFFKKEKKSFLFILINLIVLARFPYYLNLLIFIITYLVVIKNQDKIETKMIVILFFVAILLLTLTGSFDFLIAKFKTYFYRGVYETNKLYFYDTYKTIREASHIPYQLVAYRISGSWALFFISLIGYVLMIIRFPVMIISLPSVVLGIMAHKLGLRFTIYAVPFFALGFAYAVVLVGDYVSRIFINKKLSYFSRVVLPILLAVPSLYANIQHVLVYKTPTTFLKPEVATLDKLSHIAKREDYAVTWWDYGYPIRYYSGVKTVIDGGKHDSNLMYAMSKVLTSNQVVSANMARLAVEYTDKVEVAKELGKNFDSKGFILDMMKKYGYKDVNKFLKDLNNVDFKLPKKTRDVYLYLPFRLTNILPTVALFGNIDLKTGKVTRPFIESTAVRGIRNNGILFQNGLWLDTSGILHLDQQEAPINTFVVSLYKNGKFETIKYDYNPKSNIYVLWYRPLNIVLIVSKKYFDSTYVQLFFLENYDKKLFEPVLLNKYVKIYKLKK
ncbi:STT3 domain-containing protein [Caminibacter pacificus]